VNFTFLFEPAHTPVGASGRASGDPSRNFGLLRLGFELAQS